MDDRPITILSDKESWARVSTQKVGRLATSVGGIVDLVPINFAVDGSTIVFRTAAGSKLAGLTVNNKIVFEVDEVGENDGWSVVVHGTARVLELDAEIEAAEKLPLRPFVPTVKRTFVRIVPESITGRAFEFGTEPTPGDFE